MRLSHASGGRQPRQPIRTQTEGVGYIPVEVSTSRASSGVPVRLARASTTDCTKRNEGLSFPDSSLEMVERDTPAS